MMRGLEIAAGGVEERGKSIRVEEYWEPSVPVRRGVRGAWKVRGVDVAGVEEASSMKSSIEERDLSASASVEERDMILVRACGGNAARGLGGGRKSEARRL